MVDRRKKSLRGVILPAEHGSWGMIAEPLLLGGLLYPSWSSGVASVLFFSLFLLRTPGLRLWKGRRMSNPDPFRKEVLGFATLVGGVALAAGGILCWMTSPLLWGVPLLVAAPPAIYALRAQERGRTRHLGPEGWASLAVAAPVASLALIGDASFQIARWLWIFLAAKSVTSILFVRSQLRRFKVGQSVPASLWIAHIALWIPFGFAVQMGAFSVGLLAVPALLTARAIGLSFVPVGSAKRVGWIEMTVSLFVVGFLATLGAPVQ